MTLRYLSIIALLAGCPSGGGNGSGPEPNGTGANGTGTNGAGTTTLRARTPVTLSIIGTNDLHGRLARLPILAGYVNNLRAVRDRGAVLLIDAGDMFQGTLESNSNEGAAVIQAYNAIGYTAATVGNHEFDFGPVGPDVTVRKPGQDRRGALKARALEAKFPLLMANVIDAKTKARVSYPKMPGSILTSAAGVSVGIIGVTTMQTPYTTMPANFVGLQMAPIVKTIADEATRLRKKGASLIVVTAHAGGKCRKFEDVDDHSSCQSKQEIFEVARQLPKGLVNVIVAGHTHSGVAHRVNGIAIIESFANGRAFGRVDIRYHRETGQILEQTIKKPQWLCTKPRAKAADCLTHPYEGKPVVADPRVAKIIAAPMAAAQKLRDEKLGVTITKRVWRSRPQESPLGNLYTDVMRAARPKADVALTNGGGLRAHLEPGPLTYGALYESTPFDNAFAIVTLTGAQLAEVMARNFRGSGGIFSLSGVTAKASCQGGKLVVALTRENGKPVKNSERLTVATSDFLASGGDGAFGRLGLPKGAIVFESTKPIRDWMADQLRKRGGTLRGDDPKLFDPKRRRLSYPGKRPVRCP